jgi:hypothetical protein
MLQYFITVAEAVVFLFVAVSCGMAFIYYGSTFVEERLKSFTKYLKVQAVFTLVLILLMPFTQFSMLVFVPVLASNGLWSFLLFTGFPLISMDRPDLVLAVIASVLAHFLMTLHILEHDINVFASASYFLLFVWLLPLEMMISLTAAGDGEAPNSEPSAEKHQSAAGQFIARLLKRAEESLPHANSKRD